MTSKLLLKGIYVYSNEGYERKSKMYFCPSTLFNYIIRSGILLKEDFIRINLFKEEYIGEFIEEKLESIPNVKNNAFRITFYNGRTELSFKYGDYVHLLEFLTKLEVILSDINITDFKIEKISKGEILC